MSTSKRDENSEYMKMFEVETPQVPVVVLISGNGSNLQQLIDNCHGKSMLIKAVISDQAHAYGLQRAEKVGIKTIILEQDLEERRSEYCDRLGDIISICDPRMIIMVGFMKILTPNIVERYRGKMFNLHPSLLPAYKGLHTHQRVLDDDAPMHGMSIHMVSEELDSGAILFRRGFPIHRSHETAESLEKKVHTLEHEYTYLVLDIIARYIAATEGV